MLIILVRKCYKIMNRILIFILMYYFNSEFSFIEALCSGWHLMQRLTAGQNTENKDLCVLNHK